MPNLNDLFNRTGGLNGSNASPLGGVWQNQPSVWVEPTAGEVGLDGSKVTMRTSDPSLHTNSVSTASADQKVTLQFTPAGDNWQVMALLRANATTGAAYQLLFGPGAGGIGVYRRSSATESWGGAGQIGASVNNPMTVSERGSHVLTFSVIGNAFSATIDGSPIALGTITDNTITTAGRAGFGGRSFTSDSISEDDEVGGGDTTPPTITGPGGATGSTSAVSIAENTTAVHTFTANESVTWSLNGGADAARFTINSGGDLAFLSAPDFEAPNDSDTNNTYLVGVRGTDAAGNATTQTVTVTVTNVADTAGSYVISDFVNASGPPNLSGLTIDWLTFQRISDGVQVLIRTNQVTNGSADLAGSHINLVPGTAYIATGWDTAGTVSFRQFVTAT